MGLRRQLLTTALLAPLVAASAPPLRIAVHTESATSPAGQRILAAAYARLGVAVEWLPMPLTRAERELERGQLDGELLRAEVYVQRHAALLRVDPPLLQVRFWMHRRPPCPPRVSLDELRGLRIAYPRGTTAVEAWVTAAQRAPAHGTADMLRMLQLDMADASISVQSEATLSSIEREQPELCRVSQPVAQLALHHVLHARHAALRARLEPLLRAMRARGEFERLAADSP